MIDLDGATLTVRGPARLVGRLAVPGDKSLSHRALICAAMAEGPSQLLGLAPGDDVASTAAALRALGVDISADSVAGGGVEALCEPEDVVDCGNSGTSIRLLTGLCAGLPMTTVLNGDASLRGRPMLRVVGPLRELGATIVGRRDGDRAPIAIRGGGLRGGAIRTDVPSAQVKTAVMLAGLLADGPVSIDLPAGERDHTERMLRALGAAVEDGEAGGRQLVTVRPGRLRPLGSYTVPGDVSSAAFLLAGAALLPGSDVTVDDLLVNPTRAGVLDVLAEMGADVEVTGGREVLGEPVASVRVRGPERLRAVDIGPGRADHVEDEIPILAVLMAAAHGRSTVRGAEEMRVKESDRVAAIVAGFGALGVAAREAADGFSVEGPQPFRGGHIDPRRDHRIAMAFAVAGLAQDAPVTVAGADCISVSYPGFVDDLTGLVTP